jgi:6-phosphogluconate dehydrogenase
MMIGGDKAVVDRLDPIFKTLAPGIGDIPRTAAREAATRASSRAISTPARSGAGHFVKMIHNGIEYGLMQAYAEVLTFSRTPISKRCRQSIAFDLDIADIAEVWRRGSVIPSWLRRSYASRLAGNQTLDNYSGLVEDSGEGRGTVNARIDEAVPAEGADGRALRALPFAQGAHLCGENPVGDAGRFRRPQGAAEEAGSKAVSHGGR